MKVLNKLIDLIEQSIDENADNILSNGNIIAPGYKEDVDEYREVLQKGHEWISTYKQELIDITGIKTLRIKYTHNTGYFIEIPKNQVGNIPEDFIHKQTLVSAQRYTTIKLQDFQLKSDTANSQLSELEYNYFLNIRNDILIHFDFLYELSRKVEKIDFFSNAANISLKYNYTTPKIGSHYNLKIIGGKHPVMERGVDDFISNDIDLNSSQYIGVITGPNMGGKSTYLRQNALLILLSHVGYDIPAKSASIPITDRIFSRVGSGDNLFLGQSTFMVEMQEIAYILRNATEKSFVIIDEIGRGTSTYDGMSLAWSILQYTHDTIKSKTLFATHYHEIIDFSSALGGVGNFSVAVGENSESIVFLRKIIPGGIKKSYGIEVAGLAGIPRIVLDQARETLQHLHSDNSFKQLTLGVVSSENIKNDLPNYDKINEYNNLKKEIESIDINNISPLEAQRELERIQQQVKKQK